MSLPGVRSFLRVRVGAYPSRVKARLLPRSVLLGLMVFWLPALALASGPHTRAATLTQTLAMIGPLGLNPFMALASFGLAHGLGLYTLPPDLAGLGHPVAIVVFGGIAAFLHFGRSTKLTKPFAEAAGLGESAVAIAVAVALALDTLTVTGPAEAGVLSTSLMLAAALSSVISLLVVRTALDILIWISPIPFVDAIFQLIKAGLTLTLVACAILAPSFAVVLNAVILVGAFLVARWALRTARFGLVVLGDLTWRRSDRPALPRDATVPTDLGPMRCFTIAVGGQPKRAERSIELRAGRWFLVEDEASVPLGDARFCQLSPVWTGTELHIGEHVLLLPPRYRHLTPELVSMGAASLRASGAPAPLPSPSVL